ncbi:amino acid permease-associated region [Parafrankia sp. EAN1pec]|uniref:APC family permease n=1 Tax=Parafrankia sp. (strain EAN1pec) TaxID=298653 RepID=UPI00005411B8|nr:amino acid permease-associated region [Frankia sp. EAN1pec]
MVRGIDTGHEKQAAGERTTGDESGVDPRTDPRADTGPVLARTIGTGDAVVIGLGAMLGAGVFAAFAPAARAAGAALLFALATAAIVAYCNATSSARLAALYPQAGGTYVYGRRRLGDFWGYLAGASFITGKTASCAAMALTVGAYTWPGHERLVAGTATAALTAVNYSGMRRAAWLTRLIVVVVLTVLVVVVVVCVTSGAAEPVRLSPTGRDGPAGPASPSLWPGLPQAAGLLFFAFAGYARIATLGEEVRDPRRTIRRAIPTALGITLVVYAAVAVALLLVLPVAALGASAAPLTDAVRAAGMPGLAPVVRVGAAVGALGSLLALILGVSRTTLAMARDGHLPTPLAAVHPRFGVPHRAELTVGAAVTALVLTTDLRGAIGFSSFGVLLYYAVANAAAWTLSPTEGRPVRAVPVVGLLGCLLLAFSLPGTSVLGGSAVLAAAAVVYAARHAGGHPARQ